MPKSSPIQTNFSGGEIGPHAEGLVNLERYDTALEEVINYIPTIEGPLVRRPGTKFVASVKDPSKPPIFIPFKVSNKEQYLIEAGENYFRFFTDEGQVVTSGTSYVVNGVTFLANGYSYSQGGLNEKTYGPFWATRTSNKAKQYEYAPSTLLSDRVYFSSSLPTGSILEIPTIYDYNMIKNVAFEQKGNVLWINHSSIPTFTLQRFGSQDWDFKLFQPKDGPYLPLNSNRTLGDCFNNSLRVFTNSSNTTNEVVQYESVKLLAHSTSVIVDWANDGLGVKLFVKNRHGFKDGDDVYVYGWYRGGALEPLINNSPADLPEQTTINESSRWNIKVVNESSFILLGAGPLFGGGASGSGHVCPAIFYPEDSGRNLGMYYQGQRITGLIKTHSNVFLTDLLPSSGVAGPGPSPICASISLDIDSRTFGSAITGSVTFSVYQFGVYNRYFGYPSYGALHQDRLVFTGVPGRPTEFAASESGDYQSFAINEASSLVVLDTNALQFDLVGGSNDPLRWTESGKQGLYFGSDSSEFLVSPGREGQALTPTNVNSDILGNFGTARIRPVRSGDAIIYVQTSERKVRELRFFANLQSHKSTDLTAFSDHICYPDMDGLAVQKEFYPVVWGYRSDGKLISMSYSRDESQAVVGWAQHVFGGVSDSGGTAPKIKSIGVIRDSTGTYDQLWAVVQRFINGTSTVTVEYMNEPYRHKDPNQLQRDAYYLDCGVTYDSSLVIASITSGSALITVSNHGLQRNDKVLVDGVVGLNSSLVNINGFIVNSNLVNGKIFCVGSTTTNTFLLQNFNSSVIETLTYSPYFSGGKVRKLVSSVSGLTWLKNEVVDVLADGGIHGKATVNSAGVLALTYPAAVVQIGYGYKSRGKTLVRDQGSKTGSAIGAQRKTYQAAFRLRNVGDFSYGGVGYDSLHSANFGAGDEQQVDASIPLFTGIYRDGVEQDYGFYGQVFFEQSSPLPGMIQSISYFMDENDL